MNTSRMVAAALLGSLAACATNEPTQRELTSLSGVEPQWHEP